MIQQDLAKREAEGRPIRVSSRGTGWMGGGFLAAVSHVPGMEVSVLCGEDGDRAARLFLEAGGVEKGGVVVTNTPSEAETALKDGKRVATEDPSLGAQLPSIDLVTDCTPSPASGAETAYFAIENGKDVVLINIEADVAVGSRLRSLAEKKGVLYSVSSGDEPGCLMELWDFVTSLGYEPVVIGKGKNNPLDPSGTPDTVREAAKKADKDPYQVASYVDGSKTMFELGCVANATGCVPSQPGMTGPTADLNTVSEIFTLAEDGGTVPHPGVVDYVQGSAMSGGVFITVRIKDKRIASDLQYLKVGKGSYFTFFRPYHLWFLEAPISLAKASLYREPTLVPLAKPVADSVTVAKKELEPGETLDTFGGYTFRGLLETKEEAVRQDALPVALAPGARIRNRVTAGSVIRWEDVELDEGSILVRLRREQDKTT